MPLAEVLLAAGDVVGGILTAKGAAQAAQAAAEAAKQAQASAEKVGRVASSFAAVQHISHLTSRLGDHGRVVTQTL
jgi:regulator of protease activity HflC (stomatin/prohibitin superfamily)